MHRGGKTSPRKSNGGGFGNPQLTLGLPPHLGAWAGSFGTTLECPRINTYTKGLEPEKAHTKAHLARNWGSVIPKSHSQAPAARESVEWDSLVLEVADTFEQAIMAVPHRRAQMGVRISCGLRFQEAGWGWGLKREDRGKQTLQPTGGGAVGQFAVESVHP